MDSSKYNSTLNSKITYFLGAGASFNAVPIWDKQGSSMIEVAEEMRSEIELKFKSSNLPGGNPHFGFLTSFFAEMKSFGEKALRFGSIDIYAKRLFLLDEKDELNKLKKSVSIYFDLWESGFLNCSKGNNYQIIDQRYYSLLSVLLEPGELSPKINPNVSFISWNYDLQLEKAYETFLPEKEKSLKGLVEKLNHSGENKILHLNGYRGVFNSDNEEIEIVEKNKFHSKESYLKELINKKGILKSEGGSFHNSIKYAWEMDDERKNKIMSVLKETNVLVIIGYSFPAFNRKFDQALIKEFEKGTDYKRVIYQDPNANKDIVKSLFLKPENVQLEKENNKQFYIPHEFLSPSKGEFFFI